VGLRPTALRVAMRNWDAHLHRSVSVDVIRSSTALAASADDAACSRYLPLIADGELSLRWP